MIVCPDCSHPLATLAADRCDDCGRGFERANGIPELLAADDLAEPIVQAYRDHYEQIAANDLASAIQDEEHMEIEADRLLQAVGDVRGLEVCDVGVGKGMLLDRLLRAQPRSVIGVDLARPYLDRLAGRAGVQLVLANAERLPFRVEFDVVVSSDVLEHVLNVGDFLVSVRQALRPGGRFVVRVPYRDRLTSYATQTGYRYRFVHLRSFDGRSLRRLLDEAGFDVQRVLYSGFFIGRRRWLFSEHPELGRKLRRTLLRRYGSEGRVTGIDPRIGRLLMEPNVVTAVADRRPDEAPA
jgi:SAM-dependent methyltransferase